MNIQDQTTEELKRELETLKPWWVKQMEKDIRAREINEELLRRLKPKTT